MKWPHHLLGHSLQESLAFLGELGRLGLCCANGSELSDPTLQMAGPFIGIRRNGEGIHGSGYIVEVDVQLDGVSRVERCAA
jgi:hypothetical protein